MRQGAIFDLDGTILDSMGMWATADSDFLVSQGVVPPPNIREILEPLGIPEAASYFHEALGMPDSAEEIQKAFIAFVEKAYRHWLPPKAGSLAYLRQLHQDGTILCLLSATDTHLSRAALERLEVLPLFHQVLCCSDLGHSKEEPLAFQLAMERMGTAPEETVVFEDSLYAIKTAKQVGLPVIAIADREQIRDEGMIKELGDLFIHHFSECPTVVEFLRNLSMPLEK